MSELPFKPALPVRSRFARYHGFSSSHKSDENQKYGISAFYALSRETGEIRRISEVDRGLACGCFCPCCDEDLVARQGDVLVHHFAHQSNSQCNAANAEPDKLNTILLREIGKNIISKATSIKLPNYKYTSSLHIGDVHNFSSGQNGFLDSAGAISIGGKNVPLMISFRIDRRVSGSALDNLARDGLVSAIEIDLSFLLNRCRNEFTDLPPEEKMAKYILQDAARQWILISAEMANSLWPEMKVRHPRPLEESSPFYEVSSIANNRSLQRWHTRQGEHADPNPQP